MLVLFLNHNAKADTVDLMFHAKSIFYMIGQRFVLKSARRNVTHGLQNIRSTTDFDIAEQLLVH